MRVFSLLTWPWGMWSLQSQIDRRKRLQKLFPISGALACFRWTTGGQHVIFDNVDYICFFSSATPGFGKIPLASLSTANFLWSLVAFYIYVSWRIIQHAWYNCTKVFSNYMPYFCKKVSPYDYNAFNALTCLQNAGSLLVNTSLQTFRIEKSPCAFAWHTEWHISCLKRTSTVAICLSMKS